MKKVKPTTHPKSPPKSKHNWPKERKGEDVLERSTKLPKDPSQSTYT